MQMIRDILMYLDRTYVEHNNKMPVYDAGLECFLDRVARHERIKAGTGARASGVAPEDRTTRSS